MIKNLQTIFGVNVDAQYQAGEELKRGDFVKVDGGKLKKAASVDEMVGVVVRDVKATKDVAMGYPVSDWDTEQDTILKDEYCGLSNDNKESYHYFMNENLFKYLDFSNNSHYFPSIDNVNNYDEIINNHGGIDIQILGIGANGHIAFNEPNTPIDSVTHITNLANKTILDNSRFFSNIDEVPTKAITMGLSTILKAKKIYLIATGKNKAEAISIMLKGKYIKECPASALNLKKDNIYIYLDKDAASLISK